MAVIRRLAAVVVADVVGYSRRSERDESGTIERLRALRAEVIDPKIATHGGRIVKTSGDGLLLEFPSATSALRCAIEVQREMGARNQPVAVDERIEFRIGVNLGDIVIDGDDILGDGVNVAARLEPLAAPGGITISATIREHVREDLGVSFKDAGEQRVKNIARPVHVYRIMLGGGLDREPPPMPAMRAGGARRVVAVVAALAIVAAGAFAYWHSQQEAATAGPPLHSLLVVPFEVAGTDAALAAQAPKLTAEVAKALGDGVPWARTTGPDATAALVAKTRDPKALGREANVRYVVDGVLRPTARQIEYTLRIYDTRDGRQVGSTHRTVDISSDGDTRPLIRQLAAAIRDIFGTAVFDEGAASGGSNPSGWQLLARAGKVDFRTDYDAATRERGRLLDEAVKADPSLGRAWATRAKHRIDAFHDRFDDLSDRERVFAAAEEDSLRAVELDPKDPFVWQLRAQVLANAGKIEAAYAAFQRAEDIDWTRIAPLRGRVWLAMLEGEPEESLRRLESFEKAWGERSSPESDLAACEAHVGMRTYEAAIKECERAQAGNDDFWVFANLAAAYALTGDTAKAAAAKARLLKDVPRFTIRWYEAQQFRPTPKGTAMDQAHLLAGLRKAGVPE